MTLTADTITDAQIRELRQASAVWLDDNGHREGTDYDQYFQHSFALKQCDVALGKRRAGRGSSKAKARARCAEILNNQHGHCRATALCAMRPCSCRCSRCEHMPIGND